MLDLFGAYLDAIRISLQEPIGVCPAPTYLPPIRNSSRGYVAIGIKTNDYHDFF